MAEFQKPHKQRANFQNTKRPMDQSPKCILLYNQTPKGQMPKGQIQKGRMPKGEMAERYAQNDKSGISNDLIPIDQIPRPDAIGPND